LCGAGAELHPVIVISAKARNTALAYPPGDHAALGMLAILVSRPGNLNAATVVPCGPSARDLPCPRQWG
jgi:hypothetical protein